MYDGFLDQVNSRPNDEAYVYEGHHWTWREVEQGEQLHVSYPECDKVAVLRRFSPHRQMSSALRTTC